MRNGKTIAQKEKKIEDKIEKVPNNTINNNSYNDTIIWNTKDTQLHTKENL